MDELLAAHLQAEDGDRQFLPNRDVLANVHGERRFAHAGTGRNDNHFRWMQSARHPVKLGKSGGKTGNPPAPLIEFLDGFERTHDLLFHRKQLTSETIVADVENFLLYLIEQYAHFTLFFIGATHAFGAGADDLPQHVFVPNNLEVVVNIRCRWHEREQTGHEGRAADCFEQVLITQCLREGNEIDRLAGVPLFHQNPIDRLMSRNVKIFLRDFFNALRNCILGCDQHRTQHALLRLDAMGRGPVNILCRTCERALKNSSATLPGRASASAIRRCFARLLRTVSGTLRARHLFPFLVRARLCRFGRSRFRLRPIG